MFNPASTLGQLTIGEVLQGFRDLAIIGVIVKMVWHSRGIYEWGKKLVERADKFMTEVEAGMTELRAGVKELRENHLKHIEGDLAKIAGRTQE